MNQLFKTGIIVLLITHVGCKDLKDNDKVAPSVEKSSQELQEQNTQAIVNEAIKAHGGDAYDAAHYQFVFRDKLYTFNNENGYTYTVNYIDSLDNRIEDNLKNGQFTRKVNEEIIELSKKDNIKYSNALNSVIYFATLPFKLGDKAVQKEYVGNAIIKSEDYEVVKITFDKVGGGTDHDDVFMYWVNKKSHYIDYLAYSYSVNDGGVRFRSAYNPRTIGGIRFQDYINWEAPLHTPLLQLPQLFEQGQLKELSKIETEEIQNLNYSNDAQSVN